MSTSLRNSRRHWLKGVGLGSLTQALPAAEPTSPRRTVYERLGVRPVINFRGTYTTIGASKQWPELFEAQAEAAREYVVLEELQDAIGRRLAELAGTEAAMVSTGAAGSIAIGTYACIAGEDPDRIKRLPDLTGMKDEVIIQRVHRISYDHAVRGAGTKIVEVETPEQLERAIGPRTAMMYFLPGNTNDRTWRKDWIRLEDTLKRTKPAGVPVLADCANILPPWDNIPKLAKSGVDLMAISGGKHMRGPQCSGILAGREDLVRAAWLNSNPHSDSNGRPMKVGREEMVALYLACEKYASLDFERIDRESAMQARNLARGLGRIPGIRTSRGPFERMRRVHRVNVTWDENRIGVTARQVEQELMEGEPRIAVTRSSAGGLQFAVFMNEAGDEEAAIQRMREIFPS